MKTSGFFVGFALAASALVSACTPVIQSGLPDPQLSARDKQMMALAEPDEFRIPTQRSIVQYQTPEKPGTIVVDTGQNYLYYILPHGQAIQYRIASGAEYRRLDISNLSEFEGAHVHYWASPIEAQLCAGQEVALVGGGNSAGQAAVFLSGHARKVTMIIRGGGLGASMSRYLIERIEATPNIALLFNTEVVALEGGQTGSLERVRWRSRLSGEDFTSEIRNLFLFVGADPATGWLDGCGVTLDRGGFVVTGAQSDLNAGRPLSQLETSVPGVFAVGDVRSGSVKRVGGAIGEGAQVVAALHGFLGDVAKPAL